jgi:hypothetical protein
MVSSDWTYPVSLYGDIFGKTNFQDTCRKLRC